MRVALIAILACAACASPRTHRTGPALLLDEDPPRGPCEEAGWLALAPTHVGAEAQETVAATQSYIMYRTHDESADGLAVYQHGLDLRLTSDQAARVIGNTMLRPDIDAEVRAIQAQRARANGFMIAGFVATVAGGGIALSDLENPTAGLVIMGAGLVAEMIALMSRPHSADVAWAQVRERIFVDGETDFAALEQGINQVNERTRNTCAASAR